MTANLFFHGVLFVHVATGMMALVVAPGTMVTRKGGWWHRRWGQIYFWSAAAVAGTALTMSAMRSGLFLGLVAVFSFYLALTGVWALHRKTAPATVWDGAAAVVALVGSLGLIGSGTWSLLAGRTLGIVAIVFGGIGGGLAGWDLWRFRVPSADPRAWVFTHLTRMLAAYVATVSAFSVFNLSFLPPVVRWLWPTVVGTIGIALWRRYSVTRLRCVSRFSRLPTDGTIHRCVAINPFE